MLAAFLLTCRGLASASDCVKAPWKPLNLFQLDRADVHCTSRHNTASADAMGQIQSQGGSKLQEDAPGTWLLVEQTDGQLMYVHRTRGNATQQAPTSCSWQQREVDGYPAYVNKHTQQVSWTRPPAWCWLYINSRLARALHISEPLWVNWRNHATSSEDPAELPPHEIARIKELGEVAVWRNDLTGEVSYEDPQLRAWRQVKTLAGDVFWYHPVTEETTWTAPSAVSWTRVVESRGIQERTYYFNTRTGESTWGKPRDMSWRKHRCVSDVMAAF
ncbi:hypothetical protein WJX72_001026 [[Myrmecia] bisecta]|uniref:WW domain-containing protein n=1 Tax=[Myrmecia] bisecta TaxID=41462 RepID=A0AAW1Q2G2_9CHLO